jgi:pimeloyl-ACP methyl ester carboxylesterase
MIPFDDFGGSGPLAHFAHANGYPPQAYTPLLERLLPTHHVLAARARPLWPGTQPADFRSWDLLTADLITFLDEHKARGIVGIGHSMGGVSTLDAALRRPELFRALVLIDPVIFRQRFIWGWQILRSLGIGDRLHPLIPSTLRRRRVFASGDEMFARYRRAPAFSRLDDHSLRASVESLARPRPDGQVELVYSPEWEAAIYRHGPLNLWGRMAALHLPLLVIYGAESDTFRAPAVTKMAHRIPHASFVEVPAAGHLVPLEQPAAVAEALLAFLR